ncbi:hemerythrin domain-containing protein [Glaciecola sp. MH2013]|uniref:hemerythrin domain-containing protein n=1 Tax=Glaciecola sp. MH2013 TaxID=2785524 RepID=UPI00189C63FB|nr:hemerythrin domain-containing protein [Glaciecola sp. MH2013]MBF7073436.1 hemerythrin domain-containing protein [Glaciecola sp. MH2013]
MKIFEALRKDHDKQRALVKLLLDTEGKSSVRETYYQQLKDELEAHAVAEERHFYAPLMQADATVKLSRHGVAEHHQMDKLIAELDECDMATPKWMITFKQLAEKIEHHLAEEEREFFQQAGKALSEQEKEDLATEYQQEMAQ